MLHTDTKLEIRKVTDPGGDKPLTVVGWASVVTKADGTPIADFDDQVIEFDELEKSFADLMLTGGARRGGEMHDKVGGADLIGQITVSREERVALGLGMGPAGAIVKFRVNDAELKDRIRSGELGELSIAGTADEVPFQREAA